MRGLPLLRDLFDHPLVPYPQKHHSIRSPSNLTLAGMFWTSLFGLTAFFVSLVVFQILRFFWRCATSPLHQLSGPVSTSWLYGNVREYTEAGQTVLWDHWTEIYGNTFKFSTFFNVGPCPLPSISRCVIDFIYPRPPLCTPRIRVL